MALIEQQEQQNETHCNNSIHQPKKHVPEDNYAAKNQLATAVGIIMLAQAGKPVKPLQ